MLFIARFVSHGILFTCPTGHADSCGQILDVRLSHLERHSSPLIFYKGKAKRLGTSSAAFELEMRAPRHIITSTRVLYQHISAFFHLFCWNYDFQMTKKQQPKKNLKNERR